MKKVNGFIVDEYGALVPVERVIPDGMEDLTEIFSYLTDKYGCEYFEYRNTEKDFKTFLKEKCKIEEDSLNNLLHENDEYELGAKEEDTSYVWYLPDTFNRWGTLAYASYFKDTNRDEIIRSLISFEELKAYLILEKQLKQFKDVEEYALNKILDQIMECGFYVPGLNPYADLAVEWMEQN